MTTFLELFLLFLCCYIPAEPATSELFPGNQAQNISLYPLLQWNQYDGGSVSCRLTDEAGRCINGMIDIHDTTLTYYPYQILEPDSTYEFTVETENALHACSFTTTPIPMPDRWVEVILGDVQKVLVWENNQVSHAFPCSGGTPETPSLLGLYSMINRGPNFYSERVGEGAHYWIRIQGNYLFHGIVRDENDNPIPGEEEKIGTAASHGCIRLYDEDARWLYENMPDGTIVIIHPGLRFPDFD